VIHFKLNLKLKLNLKRPGPACKMIMIFLMILPAFSMAHSAPGPFFLMGDGRLCIQNVQTKKEAKVSLLLPDGSIDESALDRVDEVFGFKSQGRGEHISLRLLFMLNYFSNQVAPGRTIFLTSGYRSPEYNNSLRKAGQIAAKTSTHMDGLALDFYIEGVKGKDLWEIIRQKNCCGVGHYGGKEIHLDAARPRFWEAATSKVDTRESDCNRRIYLFTKLDRYQPGQAVRLAFTSVSDFGFGIQKKAFLIDDSEGDHPLIEIGLTSGDSSDCLPIQDRTAAHSIKLMLPKAIQEGRYRIRLDFCQRPFEQMPLQAVSNEIEILSPDK
jgi:uncharacterized protein YcbK (DUF882 family)